MIEVQTADDLAAYVGIEQIDDAERLIDEAMVEAFMAVSGDRQRIHSGAAAIVPGNLLLAQIPRFQQRVFVVGSYRQALLAGYGRVRFHIPVMVGSAIRFAATVRSVRPSSSFVLVETDCRLSVKQAIAFTATVNDVYEPCR